MTLAWLRRIFGAVPAYRVRWPDEDGRLILDVECAGDHEFNKVLELISDCKEAEASARHALDEAMASYRMRNVQ